MSARRFFARAGHAAFLLLIFLGMLLATAGLFTSLSPFAGVPQISEKFAHFAAHADDYDTLFIGSSRICRGVMPSVFDEATGAAGVPTRSFNLGIDGMFPPEDCYVFDAVAARRPKKLRRVFIESSMFSTGLSRDPESTRILHWHDWERTRLVCADLLRSKKGDIRWRRLIFGEERERQKLAFARSHLRLFCMRTLYLGRAQSLVRRIFGQETPLREGPLGKKGDGFLSMKERSGMKPAKLAEYRQQIAERRAEPAKKVEVRASQQANLDRIFRQVRKLGAEPVVIISPMLGGSRLYPRASARVPVLDFTDLDARAELFAEEHRADAAHLTRRGAELFTRALAADFIALGARTHPSP